MCKSGPSHKYGEITSYSPLHMSLFYCVSLVQPHMERGFACSSLFSIGGSILLETR